MQIFHIDDNSKMTDVFSKIFTSKKHVYISENDPNIGLKRILSENFDLILLDISMPKFSGFDLLADLKQKNFDTSKIMVLTAAIISDKELNTLESYNLRKIIFKPISMNELLNIIENN